MSDIVPDTVAERLSENVPPVHAKLGLLLAPAPAVRVASVILIEPLVMAPSDAARSVRVMRPEYLNCHVHVPRDSRRTC